MSDFSFKPKSLGDREHGSFVPVDGARTTARRVVGADGAAVAAGAEALLGELLLEMRAVRKGLELLTETDLLEAAADD